MDHVDPALILLSAVVLLACASLGAVSTRASSSTRSGQDVPRSFRPSTAVSRAGDSGFRCTGAFEVVLVAAVIVTWGHPDVRTPILIALASHAAVRIWSLIDLVPR